MPKKQKDINCGLNADKNTVEKSAKNKDAGKAVNQALNAAMAAADLQRVNFRALHCPPNDASDTRDCTQKQNLKGDKEDIVPAVTSVTYNKDKKEWEAKATATWEASFECVKPPKKKKRE